MQIHKGRGAVSGQASTRFNLPRREADGDWLDASREVDGEPAPLRTQVSELSPRTILSFNTSPDVPFDRSINAYNGCEHLRNGCVTLP
ncbi:radical SAM protein [Novosphingobium sp. KA1]|nr:radical SAM protein [Novosphingobium sp. KA1]